MATALANPSLDVERDYYKPEDPWSDDHAVEVVKRDFAFADSYLVKNHYTRWNNADRIYLAWTEQKYWEGTKVPRATPSVFLAFEQIESLLPRYLSTIFSDDPWAEAVPQPGTLPEQARISRDYILGQFNDAKGRSAFRRAAKSGLIYGNGILEAGWESFTRTRKRYELTWKPEMKSHVIPMLGRIKGPTGNMLRVIKQKEVEQQINRPFLNYLSLRDFYIDPNCQSPDIQDARWCMKRCWMTVDELDALRDTEGFDIPEYDALMEMTHKKTATQGDTGKTQAAAWRSEMWQPSLDQTSDAAGKNIEVWNYWTNDRCVWLLNREHPAYNQENSYRNGLGDPVKPFFNQYYIDVLDRFYALALTDVTEWDQRLIVSLLGGHLDEVALSLNPARIKRRGIPSLSAAQLRTRPGAIADAENPREDVFQQPVSNITSGYSYDVQAAEVRSQKTTGVTDLAVLGTPAPGGNAAARTATGSNIQSSASSGRILYLVENSEADVLEPLLSFMHGMNRDYLDPEQMIEFTGPHGQPYKIDPLVILNAEIEFKMRSGSRARSAGKLQQMLPLILQDVLNPGLLQMFAKMGKTVDIVEISNMIADAADYRPRGAWFRDMTPQEQQALNAPPPPPPPDPTKLQMQQDRLQAQGVNTQAQIAATKDNQDAKSVSDLLQELVRMTRQDRSTEKAISSKSGYG